MLDVGLLFLTATLLLSYHSWLHRRHRRHPYLSSLQRDVMYRFLAGIKGASPTCSGLCSGLVRTDPSLSRSSSLVYPKRGWYSLDCPEHSSTYRGTYGFSLAEFAASTVSLPLPDITVGLPNRIRATEDLFAYNDDDDDDER